MDKPTWKEETAWMARRQAIDNVQAEIDKTFEYVTDQIYDEEGEFHHKWLVGDKARWERIFNSLGDALDGLSVLHMYGG